MIEYLKQLIRDQAWADALSYAEKLTCEDGRTLGDLVVIHCAMLRARISMSQFDGAVTAGQVAVALAKEFGDWDSFGTACNDRGVAHFMLKEYDLAITCFKEYLAHKDQYNEAKKLVTLVWYNLSCVYRAVGNSEGAITALTESLQHARVNDQLMIPEVTLALVDARLRADQTEGVARLLAHAARYLRNTTDINQVLYYVSYRAELAWRTGRLRRARVLIAKGLVLSEGLPRHLFRFHMVMAQIEESMHERVLAIDHAMSARACAAQCERPDLEAQASAIVQQLIAES